MYTIRGFVNGVEEDNFKGILLPLDVAKIICGLGFAKIVADIREDNLDEVIVTETDTSCHAKCVESGMEFEFRIEEVGA